MTEAGLMSPNNDILTTPKESLKTPKFRGFNEFSDGLAALRSPRDYKDFDSLNTPLPLTTPVAHGEGLLSTPTLTTPRTADWGLFSPMNLGSNCSSPREASQKDNRPADLPLDTTIGLSSPHDGVLAKRRKLKNLNSSHSRSIESDSNSCDTPTTETDVPRDLSKKGDRSRIGSDSSPQDEETVASPSNHLSDLDKVRDKVGAVAISTSPKWFKHPKHLPESLKLTKELISDMPSSYHPSPLAVPSPNWTAISAFMTSEGLALKTPKVLDNFVFDVLPPNTPNTPKVCRERSPECSQPLNYEKPKVQEDVRVKQRTEGRVTFADHPRPQSLTPPPPYPEDLSMRHKPIEEMVPKQEYHDPYSHQHTRLSPPSPPTQLEDQVKEEPREHLNIPPEFPPWYIPGITPQQIYSRQSERPASPPASPPRSHTNSNAYQPRQQFYPGLQRHPGLNLSSLYDGHNPPYNMWGGHHHPAEMHGHGPHVTMPTPPQNMWNRHHPEHLNQGMQNYVNMKPNLKELSVKSETHLSSENQESLKKKSRKLRQDEMDPNEHDPNQEGQPPKKRGKGKGKNTNPKDPNGPKRVFVCPHCQRSYDWNYNLNRHLKYECGKENAFMCSKCGRRFPHKQNCVYHLKRKHKIICDTIDQYVSAGLVVFQGNNPPGSGHPTPGSGPTGHPSPSGSCYSPGMKENSVTPPPLPSQNSV